MYLPKIAGTRSLLRLLFPAFGAVKEQAWPYAQTLAERGFVTLAFDPLIPVKAVVNPAILLHPISIPKTLWLQSILWDYNLMWIVNVSVSSVSAAWGIALNAVAVDKRVKAVVASTMYDMSRVMSKATMTA